MRGLVFIAFGILYLAKPDIFSKGIWKKTSIAVKTKSPEEYKNYMKLVAIIFIIIGILLLIYDNRQILIQPSSNGQLSSFQ
jgi:predicted membrane protein